MSGPRNFSRRASLDLDEAISWLLDHGGSALRAGDLLHDVHAAGALIGDRPSLGHRRLALLPEPYRFWSLPRHRLLLVYDPTKDPVRIVRVLSTNRDVEALLAEWRESTEPES